MAERLFQAGGFFFLQSTATWFN